MQYSPEFTSGAMAIVVTIILASISGIGTLIAIYMKTRTDINRLELGYADIKADMAEMKGESKASLAMMHSQQVMLERIAARQEIMGAISSLPNDIASAVGRYMEKERAKQ